MGLPCLFNIESAASCRQTANNVASYISGVNETQSSQNVITYTVQLLLHHQRCNICVVFIPPASSSYPTRHTISCIILYNPCLHV